MEVFQNQMCFTDVWVYVSYNQLTCFCGNMENLALAFCGWFLSALTSNLWDRKQRSKNKNLYIKYISVYVCWKNYTSWYNIDVCRVYSQCVCINIEYKVWIYRERHYLYVSRERERGMESERERGVYHKAKEWEALWFTLPVRLWVQYYVCWSVQLSLFCLHIATSRKN